MKIPQNLSGLPDSFVSGDSLTFPGVLAQQEATPFTYWLLAGNSEPLQLPTMARPAKLLVLSHQCPHGGDSPKLL